MKSKYVYCLLLLFACQSQSGKPKEETTKSISDKIEWVSISDVEGLLKKEKKKIILYFYTDWCTGCKQMDKGMWVDKSLISIANQYYYSIKFNAESNKHESFMGKKFIKEGKYHQLADYFMEHPAYPTAILFDENLIPIDTLTPCFEINLYAHYYSQDYHKKYSMEDFSDYFNLFTKKNNLSGLAQLNNDNPPKLNNKFHVPISIINDQIQVGTRINKLYNLKFNLNISLEDWADNVIIPEKEVIKMLDDKIIALSDFQLSEESFLLKNKIKLPSRYFMLTSLKIGDLELENVMCEIGEKEPYLQTAFGKNLKNKFKQWIVNQDKKILFIKTN